MNRLFISLITLLLLLSSCQHKKRAEFVIGVSQCSDDEWRKIQNHEMLQEAVFYPNMELQIKTVKDNSAQQIKNIRAFVEQKVDLLVISPNEAKRLTPVVEEAFNSGIPVILIDRKTSNSNYTAFVGADNREVGQNAGIYIAQLLKNGGNILEIRGLKGSTSDAERHEGFIKEISKYPQLHIIGEYYTEWYKKDAKQIMHRVLSEPHPRIDLVFAMSDRMASGVYEAVKDLSDRPVIVGIDALPGKGNGIENILERKMTASIIYPTGGDKIIKIAMDILTGNPYLKENILKTAIVDKENARVISLQNEQLEDKQLKLVRMNKMLDHSLAQYSSQRMLFYAACTVLLLVGVILVIAVMSYRSKSKANRTLENQNEEIRKQANILKRQKEEVEHLSDQLSEATNAKLVFFTNISHEFKTPLSLIVGPVETLLIENDLNPKQRDLLILVKRNSTRLLHLISEIIEFRRFENGKMQMNLFRSDLKVFLEELAFHFDEYARNKQVDFQTICQPDVSFEMVFDKEKMEKIYFNLLSNAFKHVNVKGKIVVDLSKDTDSIRLSVFNTGSYIPSEERKNIFDRFYRLESQSNGSGIGLALVSSLVEMHKGNMHVRSNKLEGTTFYIDFPLGKLTDSDAENSSSTYKDGDYIQSKMADSFPILADEFFSDKQEAENRPLVLLIEDNTDMRHYIKYILSDEYQIYEAENGTQGIDKAIKSIPELIICDVMMPEKDGFEVCRILKENISTSHIPIVILTACSLDHQKAVGFESGAEAYIPKPFNAELLKIRVRKLIENRRRIKEIFASTSFIGTEKKNTLADKEQEFIDHFKMYVEKNIANPELNVDDIARALGLSRVQLYRKLKSLTDYTPNELIRIVRLKHAVRLLSTRAKSVSEVAYESGFSSPSYFTKCFKENYKCSPSEYLGENQ